MFRLLRFLFWCFALVAIFWFSTNVMLGKHTLWGHLKAIWNSEETQSLVNGTKDAAKNAVDKAK